MSVSLTRRFERAEDSPLEGAFRAWANPPAGRSDDGDYPFVFDAPDFDLHRELPLPHVGQLQIAAFAHTLEAFADEESYYAQQPQSPRFAAESFFPAGLFHHQPGQVEPPPAEALLVGRVVEHERIRNPFSGNHFHWARLRTLGGELDLVADPEVVQGSIYKGGILQASCWLSGRIIEKGSPTGNGQSE
jgi:hypothetical protein